MISWTVVDIESTGRRPMSCEPLTLYALALDAELRQVDSFSCTMRPTTWDKEAEDAVRIHGITRDEAMSYPPKHEGLEAFMAWAKPSAFVCHANKHAGVFGAFDFQVLEAQYLDNFLAGRKSDHFAFRQKFSRVISTHTLAMAVTKLDKLSLDSVARHYGIKLEHHNAESDAHASAEILRRISSTNNIWEIYEREQQGELYSRRRVSKAGTRVDPAD